MRGVIDAYNATARHPAGGAALSVIGPLLHASARKRGGASRPAGPVDARRAGEADR
jgi:hypothetical protein